MKPENVNPNNFEVEKILYNDEEFSIAFGTWVDETQSIGMRWNGNDEEDKGYPKVFGNPMWFLVPQDMAKGFLTTLLGNKYADKNALIEVISILYE